MNLAKLQFRMSQIIEHHFYKDSSSDLGVDAIEKIILCRETFDYFMENKDAVEWELPFMNSQRRPIKVERSYDWRVDNMSLVFHNSKWVTFDLGVIESIRKNDKEDPSEGISLRIEIQRNKKSLGKVLASSDLKEMD